MKTAIITGCLGQDGSYLTEYLLSLDYYVVGISRRKSTNAESYGWLEHLKNNENFELIFGDINDVNFISDLLIKYYPDEFYNLAAQSHVGYSFTNPVDTFTTDALSVINMLNVIKKLSPDTKFYQASTSELFGGLKCPQTGYTEESPLYPRSPYGIAKQAAYWSVINNRESYNLFACNGILFNHESPRRGLDFVTRKVTNYIAKFKYELDLYKNHTKSVYKVFPQLVLGNIDAYRDWGHANDYIKAMYLILQQDKAEEYIIATGQTHSIRELLDIGFNIIGVKDWTPYVKFDEAFMRPSEVPYLLGNPIKANTKLNWKPTYTFESMLEEMIEADYNKLKKSF